MVEWIFNPFETNDDNFSPLQDIDPDLQYYNELTYLENVSNCKYYTEESFLKKCNDVSADNWCFSVMQINLRSIPKNLTKLESYLQNLGLNFSVVGISETWLTESNKDCYSLGGYSSYSLCRENKPGGGVSLFVRQEISYTLREDLNSFNDCLEMIFIEISKCN